MRFSSSTGFMTRDTRQKAKQFQKNEEKCQIFKHIIAMEYQMPLMTILNEQAGTRQRISVQNLY